MKNNLTALIIAYLIILIACILLAGCHTRKVSIDIQHKDSTYTDLSKTTTHRIGDTTFSIPKHTLTIHHQVWKPFVVTDSGLTLAVTYDSTNNQIMAKVTQREIVLHQKIDETIIKQNNIIAHIVSDKKIKTSKVSGIPVMSIVIFSLVIIMALALFIRYKFKSI